MTRKEISDVLAKSGFTPYEIYSYGITYTNDKMKIFVGNTVTAVYIEKPQDIFISTIKYSNDEIYNIKISEDEDYERIKKLTIETKAGESEIYFE